MVGAEKTIGDNAAERTDDRRVHEEQDASRANPQE